MLATLRARLAAQEGYTLIELITALGILAVVLSGMVAMFTSGLHAEADMNERFQAQEKARMALATLRNEVRSACGYYNAGVSPGLTGPPMTSSQVTLAYCGHTAVDRSLVQSQITWCVVPVAGQYALFRRSGMSCNAATGAMRADKLVSPNAFGITFNAGDARPSLTVALGVDVNPATTGGRYNLDDAIAFRNWRQDVTP